jgi:hypothetical protein
MQQLDRKQPLVSVGLESLMAMQLKERIDVQLQQNISMTEFLGGDSVAELSRILLLHLFDNDQNKETEISPTTKMKETANFDDLQDDLIEGVL